MEAGGGQERQGFRAVAGLLSRGIGGVHLVSGDGEGESPRGARAPPRLDALELPHVHKAHIRVRRRCHLQFRARSCFRTPRAPVSRLHSRAVAPSSIAKMSLFGATDKATNMTRLGFRTLSQDAAQGG